MAKALVTPVPKKTPPTEISHLRPIPSQHAQLGASCEITGQLGMGCAWLADFFYNLFGPHLCGGGLHFDGVASRLTYPLPSNRQHLSYDVCLEVRGEIIRTVLCCIVY